MKLIATLPPVYDSELLEMIISHPQVGAVRYNTGVEHKADPKDILAAIKRLTDHYGKKLCVDLKARQLKVTEWSLPPFGPVVLNRRIQTSLPAPAYFRNDGWTKIVQIAPDGREVYLKSGGLRFLIGAGQSVNIVSPDLVVLDGYLTEKDLSFVEAATSLGISTFGLSFFEGLDDLKEILKLTSHQDDVEFWLKIESAKGIEFVRSAKQLPESCRLMAARDDLVLSIGSLEALSAIRDIVNLDPEAICASRIFSSLELGEPVPTLADCCDILLMLSWGYKDFMLSDNISARFFPKAVDTWLKIMDNT